jgi:hypothetical protein
MHALFDMYKLDLYGSAMWMGSVQSYGVALFEIELTAAKAPGDYAIINRQTGERTVMSFGLSVDGHHDHVEPIGTQNQSSRLVALGPG